MSYKFNVGEKVIVAKGETGEVAGEIAGTAIVRRNGTFDHLYVVNIGELRYLTDGKGNQLGCTNLLTVHSDNLYPV